MTTMKAAVVTQFGTEADVTEVERPTPGQHEALVKLISSGVCHTDLHAMEGDWPVKPTPPFIPGHEGVGIVEEVGPDVENLKVGDMVGNAWLWRACGHCQYCRTGWETLCEEQVNGGYSMNGSFGEYMLVDARYAPVIPEGADPMEVGPILCAGVTVYKGLKQTEVRPGQWVVISGIGGLGHIAVQYAVAMVPELVQIEQAAKARAGDLLQLRPVYLQAVADYRASRGEAVYPDANSSLRLTFGNVTGYEPRDGVAYTPFTTLEGLVAKETGADAIYPGYGFLSERADLARACRDNGIKFIGPSPETLDLTGDKSAAVHAAERAGLRVPEDVSVAGFDGIDLPWLSPDVLTSVHQPLRAKGAALGRAVLGVLHDRHGDNAVVYPILAGMAVSYAVLALWREPAGMLVAGALLGLTYGPVVSVFQTIAIKVVRPTEIGVATGTFFLLLDLGTGLGPMVLGAVVAAATGDALGAPYEFQAPVVDSEEIDMIGGGVLGWVTFAGLSALFGLALGAVIAFVLHKVLKVGHGDEAEAAVVAKLIRAVEARVDDRLILH